MPTIDEIETFVREEIRDQGTARWSQATVFRYINRGIKDFSRGTGIVRGASTGSITISGSNTFADLKDDGSGAHSLILTAGTTQTMNTFTAVSASAGNLLTITSTTTATAAMVKATVGKVSCDWLSISHIVATPGHTWYAGANSTDGQATATAGSGWIFTTVPTSGIKTRNDLAVASIKTVNNLAVGYIDTWNGVR